MGNGVGEWLDQVATRLKAEIDGGAAPEGEEVTGRELLNRFGYARWGIVVVAVIRGALEERQLRTIPDFEFEWIDNPISIILNAEAKGARDKTPVDLTIRVGILPAAHNPAVIDYVRGIELQPLIDQRGDQFTASRSEQWVSLVDSHFQFCCVSSMLRWARRTLMCPSTPTKSV